MKRILGLLAIFFLIIITGCSEDKVKHLPPEFNACVQINYVTQPENLITPPQHILNRCNDYKELNSMDFNKVWPLWVIASSDLLIIDADHEYLFTNEDVPAGFAETGYTRLRARPRVFDANLKATFPAFSKIPVIIIGAPSQEEINSGEWKSTLWHEHFHQFQMSYPGYFEGVEALGLSGGDQTGMWVLNYPFPYDDRAVKKAFHIMSVYLAAAYEAIGEESFDDNVAIYLEERRNFKELVGEDNFRYFDFQIWQEGLARYAELAAFRTLAPEGDLNSGEYPFRHPDTAMIFLRKDTWLSENNRVAFYDFGLLEGLVLDAANPGWKEEYMNSNFQIEPLYGN